MLSASDVQNLDQELIIEGSSGYAITESEHYVDGLKTVVDWRIKCGYLEEGIVGIQFVDRFLDGEKGQFAK